MTRHRLIYVILSVSLVTSACGLKGKARHAAVVADTSVYTALATLQDGEAAYYQTCTAPVVPSSLTAPCAALVANHKAFSAKLARALRTGQQINRLIRSWPAGAPAPAELGQLSEDLRALFTDIAAHFPDSPFKTQLTSWTFAAANAVMAVLIAH